MNRVLRIIGRRRSVVPLLLLGTAMLGAPTAVLAEKFRCNGHIIESGMTDEDVLKHCGQPDARSNEVHITWVYRDQPGGVNVTIFFYANGVVEKIESERN